MASIRPRDWTTKDGKTHRAFRVSYRDVTTGRKRHRQFTTRREAQAFAESLGGRSKDEVAATKPARRGGPKFSEVCADFIAACRIGRHGAVPLRPQCILNYQSYVDNHIVPKLGDLPASAMTQADITAFRDGMLKKAPNRRLRARKVLSVLKTIIRDAILNGAITTDIAKGVVIQAQNVRGVPVDEEMEIHTADEMAAILAKAAELRASRNKTVARRWQQYEVILHLSSYLGVRSSETRGLPRKAVDLNKGTVSIFQAADRTGLLAPPKTKAGRRTLFMPDHLVAMMRTWLEDSARKRPPLRTFPKDDPQSRFDHALVFPTKTGKAIPHGNLRLRMWVEVQQLAGVRVLNFHSMRHFYASRMIDAGCSLKLLTKRIGHTKESFTLETYGHLFKDAKHDEAERAMINDLVLLPPPAPPRLRVVGA